MPKPKKDIFYFPPSKRSFPTALSRFTETSGAGSLTGSIPMNVLHKLWAKSTMLLNSIKMKGRDVEFDPRRLLKDRRVIDEINRHKWLESEIAGYDIGFEKAADDWIENYADAWLAYNDPQLKQFGKSSINKSKK
jgi:hypothetical protein